MKIFPVNLDNSKMPHCFSPHWQRIKNCSQFELHGRIFSFPCNLEATSCYWLYRCQSCPKTCWTTSNPSDSFRFEKFRLLLAVKYAIDPARIRFTSWPSVAVDDWVCFNLLSV